MKRIGIGLVAAALVLLPASGGARAGILLAGNEGSGGGGAYLNLIVREVTVTPVRAHVGDVIRVDAVIENRGDGYGTTTARVYANGKPVASRLFTYDVSNGPETLYRESFLWDTKRAAPGAYRIRAEVFLWGDNSPFDNSLDVGEPVVLLPAGASFPADQSAGGNAVAVDPRWHPVREPARGEPKGRTVGY